MSCFTVFVFCVFVFAAIKNSYLIRTVARFSVRFEGFPAGWGWKWLGANLGQHDILWEIPLITLISKSMSRLTRFHIRHIFNIYIYTVYMYIYICSLSTNYDLQSRRSQTAFLVVKPSLRMNISPSEWFPRPQIFDASLWASKPVTSC